MHVTTNSLESSNKHLLKSMINDICCQKSKNREESHILEKRFFKWLSHFSIICFIINIHNFVLIKIKDWESSLYFSFIKTSLSKIQSILFKSTDKPIFKHCWIMLKTFLKSWMVITYWSSILIYTTHIRKSNQEDHGLSI